MSTTHAAFETDRGMYYAVAHFNYDRNEKPWTAYLIRDGEFDRMLGDFDSVLAAWKFAEQHLGIERDDRLLGMPTRKGEGTDGPLGKDDQP